MKIKEIFKRAVELDLLDLQLLIMFLVYEKQVHTLDDDIRKLDLYFLPKHHERMTNELTDYKAKMQLKEKPSLWRVYTKTETLYIYTDSELQARTYAITLKYEPLKVVYVPHDDIMTVNGVNIEVSKLIEGKQVPSLIGVNDIEQKYKEWMK